MPVDDSLRRVGHMLEAARTATEFLEGKSVEHLRGDSMLTHALERLIEVVGEASMRTSPEFRREHPEIDWKSIGDTGMAVIHSIETTEAERLWGICDRDLRQLVPKLEHILATSGKLRE